jgi:hypothetical protein
MLETAVTRTLIERLRNEKPAKSLLDVMNGALGTIAPKIDLLYLLGSFDEAARKTMKGIACVRNVFAHHLDASFDHPTSKLKKGLALLTLRNEYKKHYPHHLYGPVSNNVIEPIKSNRDLFLVNLKLALLLGMSRSLLNLAGRALPVDDAMRPAHPRQVSVSGRTCLVERPALL